MFLLAHARETTADDVTRDTIRREGPSIVATALTTAVGFGALGFCDFDGLRDLGYVGALGSIVGLIVALVVVPAGLRLSRPSGPVTPASTAPPAPAGSTGSPRPRG
jgi:hypothetical protein